MICKAFINLKRAIDLHDNDNDIECAVQGLHLQFCDTELDAASEPITATPPTSLESASTTFLDVVWKRVQAFFTAVSAMDSDPLITMLTLVTVAEAIHHGVNPTSRNPCRLPPYHHRCPL